jgi:hypothetical protein
MPRDVGVDDFRDRGGRTAVSVVRRREQHDVDGHGGGVDALAGVCVGIILGGSDGFVGFDGCASA